MTNIDMYANKYLGKIFYFCLKKTGNELDAADLSCEISLEIVQALARGKDPEKINAWIWAVARNRWAKWAAKRYYHALEQVDIEDYSDVLPSVKNVEDDIIHSQELECVRRELAFIRSDYRNLLVAHYFEEKSVSQISHQFGIPLGTVKTKLRSSRKMLKEGMDMARQFGTRSFQPETIRFISSGNQPSGLPFRAVNRKLPVNILCAANNNASTIEELSMELGIAMPYMEEEVGLLTESELLRKLDNGKYITNFFISPKECQNEINELCCQFAEKHYKTIWNIAGQLMAKGNERKIFSGIFSDADAQSYYAFLIEQKLELHEFQPDIYVKFKRKDGGTWGVIGKEADAVCRIPLKSFNNSLSEVGALVKWNGYQSGHGKQPYTQEVPNSSDLTMLKAIAEKKEPSANSVMDEECIERLTEQGFCTKSEDGRLQVAAPCARYNDFEMLMEYLTILPEYELLKGEIHTYTDSVRNIIAQYSISYLKDDFDYYVMMSGELRSVFASLWIDKKLYTGENSMFSALYY